MVANLSQAQQPPTYTGDFLWVNHDQKNRKALPHRGRVFGHVQRSYRKWKRKHDNQQLQASIQLPSTISLARKPDGAAGDQAQVESGTSGPIDRVDAPPPSDLPSPLTLIRHDNSDPFSCFSFSITPRVNEVISFIRDIQLPTLYYSPYFREAARFPSTRSDVTKSPMGWISTPAAVQSWTHIVQGLHDQCTALACLSTYLAMMVACGIKESSYMKYSLELRTTSSKMLRQSILRSGPSRRNRVAQITLLQQVFWHFYAEASAGNLEAALIHGRMLKKLMDDNAEAVTPHFFMLAMFVDIHLSSAHRRKPIFEYGTFGPNVYQGMWSGVDPYVHLLVGKETIPDATDDAAASTHLDMSVSMEPLQSLLIRRRQAIALEKLIAQAEGPDINTTAIFFWVASHAYIDEGFFTNYYFDKVKEASITMSGTLSESNTACVGNILGSVSESGCGRLTEAAVAMAALYLMRVLGLFDMWINGKNFYDPTASRETLLFEAIAAALRVGSPQELLIYANAHLWCLFVGAISEWQSVFTGNVGRRRGSQNSRAPPSEEVGLTLQRIDSGFADSQPHKVRSGSSIEAGDEDASRMLFNSLFARQARMMGLLSWEQVVPIHSEDVRIWGHITTTWQSVVLEKYGGTFGRFESIEDGHEAHIHSRARRMGRL
ncbi:uncharacterized protein Z520_11822 [Fonsecaea multimorphosa CBS 102226]|uniref:Transcription factor domain-containing protein n=1 Tax=Fonsecaea multimorphosa CBS 102226 TaxID=1442371 RepID=A0A0D2JH44_9EURO|nr:uncharacterized protein Z520_11822 [Fonsecaea multimorphosa CBS 102226]KIX92502.1 hypothetical protein Z520_11822 [Fonsecaea multimorphosa CBS 102226]OAL19615.1 hypothetical protein AYO22_09777 [Fonsecaea multimorphosa]